MRADLKQAATSLETVLILSEKIKVKKLDYVALELTAPAQAALSQLVAKRHLTVCLTVGFAGSKRKQEQQILALNLQLLKMQKIAAPSPPKLAAPARASRPPVDPSTIECYNCHNMRYISKNCF